MATPDVFMETEESRTTGNNAAPSVEGGFWGSSSWFDAPGGVSAEACESASPFADRDDAEGLVTSYEGEPTKACRFATVPAVAPRAPRAEGSSVENVDAWEAEQRGAAAQRLIAHSGLDAVGGASHVMNRFGKRKQGRRTEDYVGDFREGEDSAGAGPWGFNWDEWRWERTLRSGRVQPLSDSPTGGFHEVKGPWVPTAPIGGQKAAFGGRAEAERRRKANKDEGLPTLEDVGGYAEAVEGLKEAVHLPLRFPGAFRAAGIRAPRGILLHGASGTGKTLLGKAVARDCGAHVVWVSGPEVAGKGSEGGAEATLRELFSQALEKAPSIIFIDEVDALGQTRGGEAGEAATKLTSQLICALDNLNTSQGGQVVVLGTTCSPGGLDPALRRPGRFDKEILMEQPGDECRADILRVHTRNMPLDESEEGKVDLEQIAKDCRGFVGSDLEAVCTEAALECLREQHAELIREGLESLARVEESFHDGDKVPDRDAKVEDPRYPFSKEQLAKAAHEDATEALVDAVAGLRVSHRHFCAAAKKTSPSALRELAVDIPSTGWDDIGGLSEVKQAMDELVRYPIVYADKFKAYGIAPSRGCLLYGPPGCGKTLVAKAVAHECEAHFISVKGPELLDKWFGGSEGNVRAIFDKARASAPCVIFFDELDSLAMARGSGGSGDSAASRVMNQMLTEMDGVEAAKDVFIIGATNRPDVLDPAVLRPGRLDQLVYVPLPDEPSRRAILGSCLKKAPLASDVRLDDLAQGLEGYSGADVAGICRRAARCAIRATIKAERAYLADNVGEVVINDDRFVVPICEDMLREAVDASRRSVSDEEVKRYDALKEAIDSGAGFEGLQLSKKDEERQRAFTEVIERIKASQESHNVLLDVRSKALARKVDAMTALLQSHGIALPDFSAEDSDLLRAEQELLQAPEPQGPPEGHRLQRAAQEAQQQQQSAAALPKTPVEHMVSDNMVDS